MSKIVFIIAALLSGAAMAVQGSLNSVLSKFTGLLEATFIVHVIGTVVIALLLFVFGLGKGDISAIAKAPWYTYLGGILSVIILYGVAFSIPRLGVSNATTAIIFAQVLTAVLIDHFGLWGLEKVPFCWTKLAGLALLTVGAKLLLDLRA